jgi:hypothetical protein
MSQFGLIGALVSIAIYNPAVESFNSYSNRKVVKTEGIFDKDGNHVKVQPLAFDKFVLFLKKIRTFHHKPYLKVMRII